MRTLILAAGQFGDAMRAAVAEGREPRLDVFELATALDADVIDYQDVDRSTRPLVKGIQRALGLSAAVAHLGFGVRENYDAILTTGEDIGLPLTAAARDLGPLLAHHDRAHLGAAEKAGVLRLPQGGATARSGARVFDLRRAARGRATGISPAKSNASTTTPTNGFSGPTIAPSNLTSCAPRGNCCVTTTASSKRCVGFRSARESQQAARGSMPRCAPGKTCRSTSLGASSTDSSCASFTRARRWVIPILQNEYQTGIATMLEMMAMGKCVIATRTRGPDRYHRRRRDRDLRPSQRSGGASCSDRCDFNRPLTKRCAWGKRRASSSKRTRGSIGS